MMKSRLTKDIKAFCAAVVYPAPRRDSHCSKIGMIVISQHIYLNENKYKSYLECGNKIN